MIWLLLLLSGCAGPEIYPRSILANQLLRPHKDFPGMLVNQLCSKYEKDACVKWNQELYDLSIPEQRKRLNDVRVECDIAGRRWAICPDQPGYCTRERVVTKKFLGIPIKHELRVVDYIPAVAGHQRLLDSDTQCAAQEAAIRGAFQP